MSSDVSDPWNNWYFSLEINGNEVAHFRECTGFKSTAEVFTITEGGYNGRVHTRPGQSKWNTLTLKTGVSASTDLIAWRDKYLTDQFTERLKPGSSGAIVLRDESGAETRRYSFTNAVPISWEGPSMNSGGSDIAVETLEIAYETMTINGGTPAPPREEPPPNEVPDEIDVGPVQFKFASAELTPQGQAALNNVTAAIEQNEIEEMWVEGHTCDLYGQSTESAGYTYNKNLSAARAKTCMDELQRQNPGVSFHSAGYAWDYPVAANDNESHRSQNRRTQFFTSARSGKRDGELDYVRYNNRR